MKSVELIESLVNLDWFSEKEGDGGILPAHFHPGLADFKLLLITGMNATGKSFFRRVVSGRCVQEKWEHIALSMEKRTGADYTDGVTRQLMFGSESDKATGGISAHVVLMGIKTASQRTNPNILTFDEPDIGLSDEYAIDAAHRIVDFSINAPESTKLVIVATHRRAMLEVFRARGEYHHLHLGSWGKAMTRCLSGWIDRDPERLSLEDLPAKQHETFRAIHRRLSERNRP